MEGEGRIGGAVIGNGSTEEKAVVVDGEMSEDEKMNKFYALIKNYREARERRRIEQEEEEEITRKRKRSMKSGDRAASSWIPAFKWEDFGDNSEMRFRNSRYSPVLFQNSFNNMHGGADGLRSGRRDDPPATEGDGGLDLKLRL